MPADNEITKPYVNRTGNTVSNGRRAASPRRNNPQRDADVARAGLELLADNFGIQHRFINDERRSPQAQAAYAREYARELAAALQESAQSSRDYEVQVQIKTLLEEFLEAQEKIAEQQARKNEDPLQREANEHLQDILEQERKAEAQRDKARGDVIASIGKVGGKLEGIVNGVATGNISGTYNALSRGIEALDDFSDKLVKAGIIGEKEAGKFAAALGGFSKALGPIGAALNAAGVVGDIIDLSSALRQVSLSQTGTASNLGITAGVNLEQQMFGWATGLSDRDVATIQNNLMQNRAKYGTQEYQQGLEFSVNATQQYGISAQSASNLYANAVLKGTMTVGQLNEALDALQETVKNSDITMEDAVKSFEATVRELSGVAGNEAAAYEWGAEYSGLYGNQEQAAFAGGIVGLASQKMGYRFEQGLTAYQQEHQGTTTAQAALAVSLDAMRENPWYFRGANGDLDILLTYEVQGGGRFFDYVWNGDRQGLLNLLKASHTGNISAGGLRIDDTTIRGAMTFLGLDPSIVNDDEKLADFLVGDGGRGEQSGFAQGSQAAVSAIESSVESPSATREQIADSSAVRQAVASGYMTEEEAATLTQAQLQRLETADLRYLGKSTAGITGAWAEERSEVRQILESSEAVNLARESRQEIHLSVEAKDDIADSFYFRILGISSQRDADAGDDR